MINNKLKINEKKTEFLMLKSSFNKSDFSKLTLTVGDDEISSSSTAKNLGVILDSYLKLDKYINATCKSSFFHIKNIGRIRNCLSDESAAIVIHAFITNKLDYCNSLLYGLSDFQIQRLQKIQNIAARILTKSKRDSHITPILKHLHWLPIHFRIRFKILVLTFQAYHGVAPDYLCELITKHHAVRALRSNDMMLLDEPKIRGKTYGPRAFIYAAPHEWNNLPLFIRKSINLSTFKSSLKTYLFKLAFLAS